MSYRNMEYMTQLDDVMQPKDLIESCLTKGLEKGDLQMIQSSLGGCGKYTDAFNALAMGR